MSILAKSFKERLALVLVAPLVGPNHRLGRVRMLSQQPPLTSLTKSSDGLLHSNMFQHFLDHTPFRVLQNKENRKSKQKIKNLLVTTTSVAIW